MKYKTIYNNKKIYFWCIYTYDHKINCIIGRKIHTSRIEYDSTGSPHYYEYDSDYNLIQIPKPKQW